MTYIKERLIQLIEFKGIPKEEFYTSIGMTSSGFRGSAKYTTLNSDAIVKILSEIPDMNLYWLITGEGDMTRVQNIIQGDRNPIGNNQGTISGHNIGDNSINISGPISGKQKIIHPDRTIEINQSASDYIPGVSESQAVYLSDVVNKELYDKDKKISSLQQEVIDLQKELIELLKSVNRK